MGRAAHLRAVLGPSLLALVAALALAAPAQGASQLSRELAQALAVPGIDPGRSAALAVDLRTGKTVFARNVGLSLLPASNEKLPVAFAALRELGPAYRFTTEVVGAGHLDGAVWRGDLVLVGKGDPTLTVGDLDALALEVAGWGVRRVTGGIVGDESWFDERRTGPGWKARFYIEESPPLSALVVERGEYRGRTSHNPALAAASLFRQALERAGIRVAKRSRVGRAEPDGAALALDVSERLAAIVRVMGRESDNFVAEMLVKELGRVGRGAGTTLAGTRVIRDVLESAGVGLEGVRLADGSGLSKLDRLTARAIVDVLVAAAADGDVREPFVASLPVAGVNGTLEDRMRRRPARGLVRAKTGTTNLACALSGFVGDRYAFAVIQNGRPVSTWWARRAQDRFATVLAASA